MLAEPVLLMLRRIRLENRYYHSYINRPKGEPSKKITFLADFTDIMDKNVSFFFMNTNIPCWWIIFYIPPTPKIPRLIIWAKIIWLPLTSTDLHLTYLTNCDCTSFRLNLMLHLCTSNGFHSIEKEQTKNALVIHIL